MNCPYCDNPVLRKIAEEFSTKLQYDYTEKSTYVYYECVGCERVSNERITTTGLKKISLSDAERAQKLADRSYN